MYLFISAYTEKNKVTHFDSYIMNGGGTKGVEQDGIDSHGNICFYVTKPFKETKKTKVVIDDPKCWEKETFTVSRSLKQHLASLMLDGVIDGGALKVSKDGKKAVVKNRGVKYTYTEFTEKTFI